METLGRHPVIVVGGGLSGLGAAVELSGAGVPVLLLEQRPVLGGRARSFRDATTGDEIDNGQHLLIAGYSRTLAFLDRVGSRHLVDVQRQPLLQFHHPTRGFVDFRLPHLPSPLHIVWGILRTPMLSLRDRYALLRGGAALMTEKPDMAAGMTITQWLRAHRQPGEVCRCFWEPLAVAIMNERADRAPARLFLDALRQAFLRHRHDAALVFPRAGLSRLFAEPAQVFVEQHGGEVRCNADVVRVAVHDGRATEVVMKDGTVLPCSAVILTVSAGQLPLLLPGAPGAGISTMADAAASPIVSIHLWMEHQRMDLQRMDHQWMGPQWLGPQWIGYEALGLIGRRIQWVFRRERHLSLVISAAYEFVDLSNEELIAIAVEDLRSVFGKGVQEPFHAVVIREKKATFAATPGNAGNRPGPTTGVTNMFLGGDWTDTGLPATIEGAILSGQRAARLAAGFIAIE